MKGKELEVAEEKVASYAPSVKKDSKVASSPTAIKGECNEKHKTKQKIVLSCRSKIL